MLKHFLIFLICYPLALKTFAATGDTTITYIKFPRRGMPTTTEKDNLILGTKDDFDFVRMIFPPDPVTQMCDFKEFYKDGKLKFAAKYRAGSFQGGAISFYPNGKRESIFTYLNGSKTGTELVYYPEGKLYNIRVYPDKYRVVHHDLKDCYDRNGVQICKDGNGTWIFYDDNFSNVALEGPVKNGVMQGEWHGCTYVFSDTIKYDLIYKQGYLISGKSHDKAGNIYPFKTTMEAPELEGRRFDFIDVFERHLILPKNIDASKGLIDTTLFTFILEKDGSISHVQPVGQVDPRITPAVVEALKYCPKWTPRRYYGLPVQSKITFPLIKPKYQWHRYQYYMEEMLVRPEYHNY